MGKSFSYKLYIVFVLFPFGVLSVTLAAPVSCLIAAMVPGHNRNCSLDHQSLGLALVTYMPLKLLCGILSSINQSIYLMSSGANGIQQTSLVQWSHAVDNIIWHEKYNVDIILYWGDQQLLLSWCICPKMHETVLLINAFLQDVSSPMSKHMQLKQYEVTGICSYTNWAGLPVPSCMKPCEMGNH